MMFFRNLKLAPKLLASFIALLLLSLASTAAAQWKWRDANGKVQYSDLPPPAGIGVPV